MNNVRNTLFSNEVHYLLYEKEDYDNLIRNNYLDQLVFYFSFLTYDMIQAGKMCPETEF